MHLLWIFEGIMKGKYYPYNQFKDKTNNFTILRFSSQISREFVQ